MKRILFVTNDVIGDSCAGPGIRYIELGRMMAQKGCAVTLVGRKPDFRSPQPFSFYPLRALNLIRLSRESDCIIIRGGGPLTTLIMLLMNSNKNIIADLYAFTHFEVPHLLSGSFAGRYVTEVRKAFHAVKFKFYFRYFNKFWVANQRQADFLCGALYAAESLNRHKDISIIPFGYPSEKPVKQKAVLRGVVDGIDKDDFLLIWGGGVWDWLDPITLIKAMSHVYRVNKKVKLYFMGVRAPSGYMPEKGKELIKSAQDFGILNKNVFINNGWTPYNERTDFLLEADAGVGIHPLSPETTFSFRTRNLDYVYCGLPMIHTEGDVWAEIIEKYTLGVVVPAGDDIEVSKAILKLSEDRALLSEMKRNIDKVFPEYTWESISEKAAESIERDDYTKGGFLLRCIYMLKSYLFFGLRSILIFFRVLLKKDNS